VPLLRVVALRLPVALGFQSLLLVCWHRGSGGFFLRAQISAGIFLELKKFLDTVSV